MMDQTIAGMLLEHGIRLKSYASGVHERLRCPRCDGGSDHEASLSVQIDADGAGATWTCHRGSCGWAAGERLKAAPRLVHSAPKAPGPVAPPAHAASVQHRTDTLYAWWRARGISEETVDAFGLYTTRHAFPDMGMVEAMVFPYVAGGRVENRKYRPLTAKHPQSQEAGARAVLFNADAVVSPDMVVWVEGEPDCLAVHEAGYPQVVSLPNGAPAKLGNPEAENRRFAPLEAHAELLGKVTKFVLAGDMDEPGMILREELARRLGRHRCWVVNWPDGCKDANDTLLRHGAPQVAVCIEAAKPYPIDGVQELEPDGLEALYWRAAPETLKTGLAPLDAVVRWPGEGRLILFTGLTSHGKSSFLRFVMVRILSLFRNRRFLVFSPEMSPWQEYAATCAEVLVGKPFRGHGGTAMTQEERLRAGRWLHERVLFLAHDSTDSAPTLAWLLERAIAAILSRGITDIVMDPWNEISQDRGANNETDYTGRSLQQIKAVCSRHGVNCWMVVHPAKPLRPAKPGQQLEAPSIYDAAGSAHFANKADLAVTIHTPVGAPTQIIVRKSRFRRWAVRGTMAQLDYDVDTGRYDAQLGATPAQAGEPDDIVVEI